MAASATGSRSTLAARTSATRQAIVNSGREAGASLEHPHGQLLGMSFIPRELAEEQARFARFVGSCLLCTTIEAEENSTERVIYADDRVVVVCPFWSAVALRDAGHPPGAQPPPAPEPDRGPRRRGRGDPGRTLQQLARRRRRRRLQPRLPLRPLPGRRALPLARAHLAQGDHDGRLRARHRRGDQRDLAEEAAETLKVSAFAV